MPHDTSLQISYFPLIGLRLNFLGGEITSDIYTIYTAGQKFRNIVKICITHVFGHFHELIRKFIDALV
jgi:hypothetical protein